MQSARQYTLENLTKGDIPCRPGWPRARPCRRAAPRCSAPSRVSSEQWRSAGYVAVSGLWPLALIERLSAYKHRAFPQGGSSPGQQAIGDGMVLGVDSPSLRLCQAHSWAKTDRGGLELAGRGERDNDDQRMHVDHPNNSITHPVVGGRDAVACLLYLGDIAGREGGTAFVPRDGGEDPAYQWPLINLPGAGGHRWINDRTVAEPTSKERRTGPSRRSGSNYTTGRCRSSIPRGSRCFTGLTLGTVELP